MKRLLAILMLLTTPAFAGDVFRYNIRVVDSSADPTRIIPQYIHVEMEADFPLTDVNEGDFGYADDKDAFYSYNGGAWVSVAASGSTHDLLSATHTDTTAAAVSVGALISGGAFGTKWEALTFGANDDVLRCQDVLGPGCFPDWESITYYEAALEAVMDLQDMQGAVTDAQVPNNITITTAGTAGTATSLVANGGNCGVGNYARGVDEFGVAENCTAEVVAGYNEIQNAGVPLTHRTTLNFTGVGMSCADFGGTLTRCSVSAAPLTVPYWTAAADANLTAEKDLSALGTGLVVNTAGTPSIMGANTCTNQFARSDTASGVWTCATVGAADLNATQSRTTLTASATVSDAIIATYTPITGLSFTPAANTNYIIECYIIYTTTAATTGISLAWDTPAGITAIHATGYTTTTATGGTESIIQIADNVASTTANSIITVNNLMRFDARLRNGGTSATMSLGITPETANSVSALINSTCQYWTY